MVTSQLTAAGWILLGVSVVIAVAGFVWALMRPGDARVSRWSSHYGLALTDSNRSVVAGYLRSTRSLQVAGAALGWVSSPVYVGLAGRPFPLGDSWVMLAVAGYLIGAAVAEMTFLGQPRPRSTVRAAVLAPRTLSDYVPAATVWTIRVLPIATVIVAAIYAIAPKDAQRGVDPSVAFMIAASILVVAFAVLVERPGNLVSKDQIMSGVRANVRDGNNQISLATEDMFVWRTDEAGLPFFVPNRSELLDLYRSIIDYPGVPVNHKYVEEARRGDHICYFSDLRKMQSDYPDWGITRTLDDIFLEIYLAWRSRLNA